MIALWKKTLKVKNSQHKRKTIDMITKDTSVHLHQSEEQFITTQQLIRMKYVFKGWVMKNQLNANNKLSTAITQIKKAMVKTSVQFYLKARVHRNELFHDDNKCRTYFVDSCKGLRKRQKKKIDPK